MPDKDKKISAAWDFLIELKRIDMLIDTVNMDYTETLLRAQPKGRSYNGTGSFNAHSLTNEVEELSTKLVELSEKKQLIIRKYAEHKTKFYHIANKMHTTEYIDLLVRYFARGQKMERIADDMNYSRSCIYRKRTRAIAEFAEYMEDEDGIHES